jgi:hypothetical protein
VARFSRWFTGIAALTKQTIAPARDVCADVVERTQTAA